MPGSSSFTREELRRGLGTLEGEAPTNPEICKLSAPGIETQICCQELGPRSARKAESRWVDPETKGAEVRSAGSRAARSSGGGRGMGSARAGVDGGLMDLEPELATVEVPAGRVLRFGAVRLGLGESRGPWGGRGEEYGGSGGPDCLTLTPRLLQCPGAPRRSLAVPEATPALAWSQGLPPRRLGCPGRATAPVPGGALAAVGRGARGASVRGTGRGRGRD